MKSLIGEANRYSAIHIQKSISKQTQIIRFDRKRYTTNIKGNSLFVPDNVLCVWSEQKKDKHGVFFAMMCLKEK